MKMTPAQRQHMMLHAPVERIIPRLAVPTIISMLITTIYNMADTFFVGKLGEGPAGAVSVVFTVMALIQAVAFTFGMGTGTNLSQALGRGDREEAARYASVGFFSAIASGVVILLVGLLSLQWLVPLLGATDDIRPYAEAYATYIFYAAPFMMGSFVMNNLLRFQGLATYGMVGITTGGILNMALDPIFIFEAGMDIGVFGIRLPFGFGMETAGAAVATAISQAVSFFILLAQCNLRRDTISIDPRIFRPTKRMYGRILNNGLPSMGRQGIASISTMLLNNSVKFYVDPVLQTAAIAAMGIVSKIVMFVNSTIIGFGQGFQPVCSFNYGAGQYSRVRRSLWFCVRVSTAILLALSLLVFLAARPLFAAFLDEPDAVRIGAFALRCHLTTLPLWGFIVMSNMFTQSIGYGVRSLIISTSRQGLCLIPMLLSLPPIFHLTGVQIAQPVADVLALGVTVLIMRSILKQFADKADKPLAEAV